MDLKLIRFNHTHKNYHLTVTRRTGDLELTTLSKNSL